MSLENDLNKHFRRRMLHVISDIAQSAEIAEMDQKQILSIVIGGLFYELVRAAVVSDMNEKTFIKTCQYAYRAYSKDAQIALEEFNERQG